MPGNPLTDPNWAKDLADTVDRYVGKVRTTVTDRAVTAVRAVVFGIVILIAAPVTFALLLILGLVSPAMAQTPDAAAPAAPAEKSAASDAEAKLAVVLHSYTLLETEVDQLKEANTKLATEKTALETRFNEAQAAMPLAAQTVALREQLRQVQAQLAAYAEENAELKNRLSLGASVPGRTVATPVPTAPAPVAPPPGPSTPPKPAPRSHVIAPGDTLLKISQTYYGTPSRWNEILAANHDALRDEKSLVIGRTLVIP